MGLTRLGALCGRDVERASVSFIRSFLCRLLGLFNSVSGGRWLLIQPEKQGDLWWLNASSEKTGEG